MSRYGAKELAAAFRTVRKNTHQIADEIPEDQYDFVSASGVRTVRAYLCHIALAPTLYEDMHRVQRITTAKGYDFFGILGRVGAEEAKPRTKSQIVELLMTEGERFATWLGSLSPEFLEETYTDPTGANPKSRLESLMSVKEHEMHHRAQLMLIERQLGITPHLTRQMLERRAAMAKSAG